MRVALVLIYAVFFLFAQEQSVKIDMHGGKNDYSYEKKNSFRNSSMGLSTFIDKNATKKIKPTKK